NLTIPHEDLPHPASDIERRGKGGTSTTFSGAAKPRNTARPRWFLFIWISGGHLDGFIEEQRLADECLHHVRVEGLRHQEGRLRPLAREQALRKCCDEDDRDARRLQDFVDRIDTGT